MTEAELKALVDDDGGHREKECQPALSDIALALCKETPKEIILSGREEPNRFGGSDFVVSAIISDGAVERRVAYVWEVKAPQCAVMEYDDYASRLRPTKHLIKAETQLLHYTEEFRGSASFRQKYGLDAFGQVVPAGIIIGRAKSPVQLSAGNADHEKAVRDYQVSMAVRSLYIYTPVGIQLKNWDWVCAALGRLAP